MFGWLLFLLVTVPLVELYLLIELGGVIGAWPTVGLVVLTGVIGSWLLRQQGMRTVALIRADLDAGRLPTERIVSGLFILVGGAFLLTPGILTDVAGFLLMVPGNRRLLAQWLRRRFETHIEQGGGAVHLYTFGPQGPMAPDQDKTITVEAEDDEPDQDDQAR